MSSSSRSPLLPPYAMPPVDSVNAAATSRTDHQASVRLPFVPPSFSGELPYTAASRQLDEPAAFASPKPDEPQAFDSASATNPVWESYAGTPVDGVNSEAADDSELPWIEEFADTSAADSAYIDDASSDPAPVEMSDNASETWAIDEAGPSIAHIANDLASASAPPDSGPPTMSPAPATHTPWQDDEAWMDIMPTLPNTGSHDPALDTSWARAFAEPMAPLTPPPLPAGDTQAAAASLEAIARRLRSGEISVPGFKAESGDAAALAATLSALLTAQD